MNTPDLHHLTTPSATLAILIGVISVARTARLLIFDAFPPVFWVRAHVLAWLGTSKWAKLAECPFCLAPYLAAGNFAWAYYSDLHWSWWLLNGVWAGSYAAAILVAYDEGVTG